MMSRASAFGRRDSLVAALLDPAAATERDPRHWNELLWLGRRHGLLARLGAALSAGDFGQSIPHKALTHLRAASIAAESSQTAVGYEINRVMRALGGMDVPVILLTDEPEMGVPKEPIRGLVPRHALSCGVGYWISPPTTR